MYIVESLKRRYPEVGIHLVSKTRHEINILIDPPSFCPKWGWSWRRSLPLRRCQVEMDEKTLHCYQVGMPIETLGTGEQNTFSVLSEYLLAQALGESFQGTVYIQKESEITDSYISLKSGQVFQYSVVLAARVAE